jgi:DNA primase
VPLFEFAIKGVLGQHDLNTTEGQLAALDEAAPIVAKIKDRGLRTRYAVNLDRWLGMMDERFVLSRVKAHAGDSRDPRRAPGQAGRHEDPGTSSRRVAISRTGTGTGIAGPNGNGQRDGGKRGDGG